MRAVVQRVRGARVHVGGDLVGAIPADRQGLFVLAGVARGDGDREAGVIARKIAGLRILDASDDASAERRPGELSAVEAAAPVLVVSQFTLLADTRRGRRPSWHGAAPAESAERLVTVLVQRLRDAGLTVATGRFGASMAIDARADGPVTILLEEPPSATP